MKLKMFSNLWLSFLVMTSSCTTFTFFYQDYPSGFNLTQIKDSLDAGRSITERFPQDFDNINNPDNDNTFRLLQSPGGQEFLEVEIKYRPNNPPNDFINIFTLRAKGDFSPGSTVTGNFDGDSFAEVNLKTASSNIIYRSDIKIPDANGINRPTDTFFTLNIKSHNRSKKRMVGTFYMGLRALNNPMNNDAILVYKGNFNWDY